MAGLTIARLLSERQTSLANDRGRALHMSLSHGLAILDHVIYNRSLALIGCDHDERAYVRRRGEERAR